MAEFNLTAEDFFGGIHLGSYVCALKPELGQHNGKKLDESIAFYKSYDDLIEQEYFDLNLKGYGIHYTPNAVKTTGNKNRKDNIEWINAWLLEIDIDQTKQVESEEDLIFRESRKAEIRGAIFCLNTDIWPSLMVETRNGFQISWFAKDAIFDNFNKIADALHLKFQKYGADRSGMNYWSMFRVPYMRYWKCGETGLVEPFGVLSTLKLYSEAEMMDFLKLELQQLETLRQEKQRKDLIESRIIKLDRFGSGKKSTIDIVLEHRITDLLPRLSGSEAVRGDIIRLTQIRSDKAQIIVNDKMTPNWVDTKRNMLFSNNVSGMANLIHYLEYYGHSKKEAINILYKLITQ